MNRNLEPISCSLLGSKKKTYLKLQKKLFNNQNHHSRKTYNTNRGLPIQAILM